MDPVTLGMAKADAKKKYLGLAAIARGETDIAVRALRSDLDCGYSTCIGWHGDSTGDSYGETTGTPSDSNPRERTPVRLAQKLGAAFPDYHVLARRFNPNASAVTTLQTKAAGREYTRTSGRSVRWQPGANPFTTGVLDIAIRVAPDNWASGSVQTFVASTKKQSAAGVVSDSLAFKFGLWSNGALFVQLSENGSSWTRTMYSDTVPSQVNGTPKWVRLVLAIVPGSPGSISKSFFHSTDESSTWTQIGGTEVLNGATAAMFWDPTNFIELGANGWTGTADVMTGNITEVVLRDGNGGNPVGPCLPRLWERYGATGVTYGGAPTLYLANSSWSGSTLANHMDVANFGKLTPDYGQAVSFFNMSHNQGGASGRTQWLTPYEAWVDAVLGRTPNTAPVAVLQNPHTSAWVNEASFGVSHQLRMRELARLAGRRRWGQLDLFRAFTKDSRGVAALTLPDGLHPNNDGYELAGKTAAALFGIGA